MRIALTGATGFVGRHCTERFLDSDAEVRAWYRGDTAPSPKNVDWVPGELDNAESADRLVENCDAIVHTALSRSSDSFMSEPEDPIAYYQTNVLGTLRLIEAAKNAGVSRFIFLSSGAVHEKVAEDLPLDERHPLWPASLYGACKASVETLVHAYGFSGKLKIATLRPVSIVGVDDPIQKSKWFDLIQSIAEGKTTGISGGGKVVYVQDVVSAIECLLRTNEEIAGETYNLCSGFVSHHQVAEIAREVTGHEVEITGTPKTSTKELCTQKIERLGMHFSGDDRLRQLVRDLLLS